MLLVINSSLAAPSPRMTRSARNELRSRVLDAGMFDKACNLRGTINPPKAPPEKPANLAFCFRVTEQRSIGVVDNTVLIGHRMSAFLITPLDHAARITQMSTEAKPVGVVLFWTEVNVKR